MDYTRIGLEDVVPMMERNGYHNPDLGPDFTDTVAIWASNNFRGCSGSPGNIPLDELIGYIFFSVGAFVYDLIDTSTYLRAMNNIDRALRFHGTSIERELRN